MRNLSVQEQKQIVGGTYYYKIFTMDGVYVSGSKSKNYVSEDECINDCIDAASYDGFCGRVYDAHTGKIIFRW